MKKMLFSAIAMVAFSVSGFSNTYEEIENKSIKLTISEIPTVMVNEMFVDEFERNCVTFSQEATDIFGNKYTKSVTVCSYHHTHDEIVKQVESLHNQGKDIFSGK